MGCHKNISETKFPRQGEYLLRRVRVSFHYEPGELMGTIVRDDVEDSWKTIIQLDDGRYILGAECQYMPTLDLRGDQGD